MSYYMAKETTKEAIKVVFENVPKRMKFSNTTFSMFNRGLGVSYSLNLDDRTKYLQTGMAVIMPNCYLGYQLYKNRKSLISLLKNTPN